MSRVLVISGDTLPYPGYPTTGAGLRAWGLGEGLRLRGHDVRYAMPGRAAAGGGPLPESDPPILFEAAKSSLDRVVRQARPDVVVFQHWYQVPYLAHLDLPIVLDFHGPALLENAYRKTGAEYLNVLARRKVQAIRRADFFTCAGEFQKRYFLGWLLQAGVDLTKEVIFPIPISLAPEPPTHTWPEAEVNFVYGGIFLPWQDPGVALKALVAEMERLGRGRLDFFGGKHPLLNMDGGVLAEMEPFLAASPRVVRHGMVPRDNLVAHYTRSYVALDVFARNYERELAFTTRTAEYLWCGLAVVYADYGELAGYIREYEAGWLVSPDDPAGVARTLREILQNPAEARRRGQNAQRLARERLSWDKTIAPLDAFCRNPVRRAAPSRAQRLRFNVRCLALRALVGTKMGDVYKRIPTGLRHRLRDAFKGA